MVDENKTLDQTVNPEKQKDEVVTVETGPIVLPKFNPTEYIGKDAKIEFVELRKGENGYYVFLKSNVIGKFLGMDISATKLLGLQENVETKKIGWTENSAMAGFLIKMGVKHWKELVGKPIKIQTITSKKDKTKEYLTF